MKNRVIISLLLLFVTRSACQQGNPTSNTTTTTNSTRPVGPRIGPTTKICKSWDDSGSTDLGEICEEDFKYDEYGCLLANKKLARHKGKRIFGQKCDGSGGENECLLLAPGTDWSWKDYKDQRYNYLIGDCPRRTNLVCHGYYNRCYCSTKLNPGDYYQYDKGRQICVIRPGFPCANDYDCTNGTTCTMIYVSEGKWQKVCNCDFRLDLLPWMVNSTYWDYWFCSEDIEPEGNHNANLKPRRHVEFHFNSKIFRRSNTTQIFGNVMFHIFCFIMIFINFQHWKK